MKAVTFPEVNMVIAKDQPQYASLPSYIDLKTGLVVNCFEVNDLELEMINTYKRLWIHHFTGGVLQPYNIVAVKDYFSSVIHQGDRFTVQEQEKQVENEIEGLVNPNQITTPIQSLFAHMIENYNLKLTDLQLEEISKISKEI